MKKSILAITLALFTVTAIAEWTVVGTTPKHREDNTALGLSEIDGFKMYCGGTVGDYQDSTFFPGATLPDTTFIITGLSVGTHYCVFTTLDIDGRESMYSEYVTLVNDGKADPKPPMIVAGQIIRVVTTLPLEQ